MHFQKLTIHNIASIEDAEIDFEAQPLADSEVFLITGKTGAGKSTILDAICLALFANTPRMKNTSMEGESKDGARIISISDPRQLMRRNTGEAFVTLTFTGNNLVHYEATWSVSRARKKPTGNLQPKDWKLKNLDTCFTIDKDHDIQVEMKAAIGLEFKQFCRTTMLAQGEFTRFLNSKDEDKAAILEKITGVDIYSKIGAKIFEITGSKKQAWENAQQLVAGITTLSDDQIAAKREALGGMDSQYKEWNELREKESAKSSWLKRDVELDNLLREASAALLTAQEVMTSDSHRADEQLVNDWNVTFEARLWMDEAAKADKAMTEQKRLLTAIEDDYTAIMGETDLAAQERTIRSLEEEAAAICLPALRQKRDASRDQLMLVNTAKERISALLNERNRRERTRTDLEQRQKQLAAKREKSEAMTTPLHDAELRMNLHKEILDKQKDTVDKFARQLRMRVRVGDLCPICRQEIRHELPHEEELSAIVDGLQKDFLQAEKDYKTLFNEKLRLDAEIRTESALLLKETKAYNEDNAETLAQQQAAEACTRCGITWLQTALPGNDSSSPSRDTEDAAIKALEDSELQIMEASSKLELQIRAGEEIENKAAQLRKALDQKRAKINALTERKTVALTKKRATEDLLAANQKRLTEFFEAHPALDNALLLKLNAHSAAEIKDTELRLKKQQEEVIVKQTLLGNAQKLKEDHLLNMPALQEEDTQERISARIRQCEEQLIAIGEKKGIIIQELKVDEENKLKLQSQIEDAENKHKEYLKWTTLNQMFGDATGNRFRKIAQSYVLDSLIHSANSYLKNLTDRYTLHVAPGTFVISLEDAYQGFASRTAITISGGESFLVSLSLALALSDIGQQWKVDTLFIDEGFGSLSGEPLQNAINTLRSLHRKGGRHVGIISHVEELQERIPVQIQVNQEGNSSCSTISVCKRL